MQAVKSSSQLGSPCCAFGSPVGDDPSAQDALRVMGRNCDCLVRAMSRSYRESSGASPRSAAGSAPQSASSPVRSPAALGPPRPQSRSPTTCCPPPSHDPATFGPPPARTPPSMTSGTHDKPPQHTQGKSPSAFSPTKGSPSYLSRQHSRSNGSTPLPCGGHVRRHNPYVRNNEDSLVLSTDDLTAAGATTRETEEMLPAAHRHFAHEEAEGPHGFDDVESHDGGDDVSSPAKAVPRAHPRLGVSPERSALASGRQSRPGSHPHFGRSQGDSPRSEEARTPNSAIKYFGNAVQAGKQQVHGPHHDHGPSACSQSTAAPQQMDITVSARSTLPFESQHLMSANESPAVRAQNVADLVADDGQHVAIASQLNRQHLGLHGGRSPAPAPPTATRTWDPIPVTAKGLEEIIMTENHADVECPPGFVFTVYNGDISRHFNINSEDVRITRGAIKYVDHHARYGAQMRFRFQLCHNFLQQKCVKGVECSYIHATKLTQPHQVHLNPFAPRRLAADRHGHGEEVPPSVQDDPAVVEQYETLPPGYVLYIHPPNAAHSTTQGMHGERVPLRPQRIQSSMIIWTRGGDMALKHAMGQMHGRPFATANNEVDNMVPLGATGARPRHCAHYQFKRLCNLGRDCQFIHSKIPFAEATAAAAVGASVTTHADPVFTRGNHSGPASRAERAARPYGQQQPPRAAQQYKAPSHYGGQQQQQGFFPPPNLAVTAPPSPQTDTEFMQGVQYAVSLLAMQQQMQAAAHTGVEPNPAAPPSLPATPPTVAVPPELWAIAYQQYHHNAALISAYSTQRYVAAAQPFLQAAQPLSQYLPAE